MNSFLQALVVGTGCWIVFKFWRHTKFRVHWDRTKPILESDVKIDNTFYDLIEDWRTHSLFEALVALTPTRIMYIEEILKKQGIPLHSKILDIGCGAGLIAEEIAKKGFHVTGIDMSRPSLESASKRAKEQKLDNLNYFECNAYDLSRFSDNHFDAILMCDVLEHFHDLQRVIHEMSRVLKPGGVLIFDTLNRTALSFLFGILVFQELPIKIVPNHVHHWGLFIKPQELEVVLKRDNILLKETKGLNINFLNWNLYRSVLRQNFRSVPFFLGGPQQIQYVGFAVKT